MSGVDGTWSPDDAVAPALPDAATLARLAAAGTADPVALQQDLSAGDQQALALGAHAGLQAWAALAAELDEPTLLGLVRCFTVAEQALPGCEAGDASPVISLARELRHRGAWPEDLRAWIRANSDNRFLPWGNLLHRL